METDHRLTEKQIETLVILTRTRTLQDRQGVSVATVAVLRDCGLVVYKSVLHEERNPETNRMNRRPGWSIRFTPDGAALAARIEWDDAGQVYTLTEADEV